MSSATLTRSDPSNPSAATLPKVNLAESPPNPYDSMSSQDVPSLSESSSDSDDARSSLTQSASTTATLVRPRTRQRYSLGGLLPRRERPPHPSKTTPPELCGAKTKRGHCALRRSSCPWANHRPAGYRSPLDAPCLRHPHFTLKSCRRCAKAEYLKACFA
jgi:hypothetical protein